MIMTIKQGRYTENGKFKAWITRIAHNLIIDYFRQERSENTVSNDEVEVDLFNNIKLCDGTIEDNIVRHQILSDVKKLVKHLPDSQREVWKCVIIRISALKKLPILRGLASIRLWDVALAVLNMRRMAEENSIELCNGLIIES